MVGHNGCPAGALHCRKQGLCRCRLVSSGRPVGWAAGLRCPMSYSKRASAQSFPKAGAPPCHRGSRSPPRSPKVWRRCRRRRWMPIISSSVACGCQRSKRETKDARNTFVGVSPSSPCCLRICRGVNLDLTACRIGIGPCPMTYQAARTWFHRPQRMGRRSAARQRRRIAWRRGLGSDLLFDRKSQCAFESAL